MEKRRKKKRHKKGENLPRAWVPAVTNLRQGRHTATKISLHRALATRNRKIRQPKQRVWPRTASQPAIEPVSQHKHKHLEGSKAAKKIESQPASSLFLGQKSQRIQATRVSIGCPPQSSAKSKGASNISSLQTVGIVFLSIRKKTNKES